MLWSKLNARLGSLRATSLTGRLEFHSTRYRRANHAAGRTWITFDGVEVLEFSDIRFEREYYGLVHVMRAMNDPQRESRSGLQAAYEHARNVTSSKGNVARFDFARAAVGFLSMSIDDALASIDPIVRGLAVIDRRIGKRRVATLANASEAHPIVRTLLQLRCVAEGVTVYRTSKD